MCSPGLSPAQGCPCPAVIDHARLWWRRFDQGGHGAATGSLSGAGNVKVDRRITLDMIRGEGLGRREDNRADWVKVT